MKINKTNAARLLDKAKICLLYTSEGNVEIGHLSGVLAGRIFYGLPIFIHDFE